MYEAGPCGFGIYRMLKERRHECWVVAPSNTPREMPTKLPPLQYPDRFEVRDVSANGGVRWNRRWVNVSIVCVGEYVGLEEIDDGLWEIYFGPLKLSRLNERRMLIEDEFGRLRRHNV